MLWRSMPKKRAAEMVAEAERVEREHVTAWAHTSSQSWTFGLPSRIGGDGLSEL